jgi:protein TonB
VTDVTDVILARQAGSDAFNRMVGWSLLLHALLVLPVVLGIVELGGETVEPPRTVMTISLSGAPGPRTGTTPMAGREIPPPPPQPAPPRPTPAPARPQPTVAPQPQQTRPRPQPASEEAPQPGATRTETGARGRGFGLATGGGGGTGVQLDVTNFCCPEYIQQMVALIQQNWIKNHGLTGSTHTRFTITRSGTIEQAQVLRSSGFQVLDDAAIRALLRTRLPELPPQYTNATLGVQVTFQYER